ncbi:hypothetical protein N5W20_09225 [Candidatus Kirkpatrickella diaphorinae]|uniref:Uncharacterized protein n=1 Tax=Candidatus Kirkpatrickella diaphorinae TaxID=2984322 RepID=A0ABY6GKA4_9PROT|nr:hypothetical protein [Candidatus Kirkpatrickella diaphorinae]UYH51250.1 hypothetical protein N5W20_09225 [Candidatus Kirkpatrickella diaphorinae]
MNDASHVESGSTEGRDEVISMVAVGVFAVLLAILTIHAMIVSNVGSEFLRH